MQFIYLTLFLSESEPEMSIDFILITCFCHTIPFLIKHVLRLKIFRMNNETIIAFGFGIAWYIAFSLTWPASMLIYCLLSGYNNTVAVTSCENALFK